jgi:hypothetical protein
MATNTETCTLPSSPTSPCMGLDAECGSLGGWEVRWELRQRPMGFRGKNMLVDAVALAGSEVIV